MTYRKANIILSLILLAGIFLVTMPLWNKPQGQLWAMASMYVSPVLLVISMLGFIGVSKYKKIDNE